MTQFQIVCAHSFVWLCCVLYSSFTAASRSHRRHLIFISCSVRHNFQYLSGRSEASAHSCGVLSSDFASVPAQYRKSLRGVSLARHAVCRCTYYLYCWVGANIWSRRAATPGPPAAANSISTMSIGASPWQIRRNVNPNLMASICIMRRIDRRSVKVNPPRGNYVCIRMRLP